MSQLTAAARTAITAIMIGAASIGLAGAATAAPTPWNGTPASSEQDCVSTPHTENASMPCTPESSHQHQLDGRRR